LIIQYRAPETGCLFFPEDIILFRKNNIDIIIVCHEFYINKLRPYLKNMTIKVLNEANITFFFNKIDYLEALDFGFKGIHYYTTVPVLLNMPNKLYIPTLEREENILYFGLIRPSKGFLNILLLAKLLYEKKDKRKVIIVGKCEMNDNILIKKWIDRMNIDIINNNLEVNNMYKSNLEIYVNPNDNLLFKMANRCQFSYKSDAKGFAFNSSSLINILYLV
jgi:glycosyltransferase involved in cell wall biosynthesis